MGVADCRPKNKVVRGVGRLIFFDGGLIDEHNRDPVFHRVHAMTLRALQTLRRRPVFEGLLARRANEDFQKLLGKHDSEIVRQPVRLRSRGLPCGVRFYRP